MNQPSPVTSPLDMDQVRWIVDVLEERDVRICALLSSFGDRIPADTYDYAIYRLALETAEDDTTWHKLRDALGLAQAKAAGDAS